MWLREACTTLEDNPKNSRKDKRTTSTLHKWTLKSYTISGTVLGESQQEGSTTKSRSSACAPRDKRYTVLAMDKHNNCKRMWKDVGRRSTLSSPCSMVLKYWKMA